MNRATDFEFRWRAAIFGVIYGGLCSTAFFDHTPSFMHVAYWLRNSTGWNLRISIHAVLGAAAAMFVIGGLVRTWGSAYLGRLVVHDHAIHSESLTADGPYRRVRNPLYLGNVIMSFGMGLVAPRLAYVPLVVLSTWFIYRLILREESELLAAQGDSYRAYLAAVPRLFPALTPRIPSSGRKPDWGNGMAAEAYFWSFGIGMTGLAITLSPYWFFGGILASPALSAIAGKMLKRRDDRATAAGA